MYFEVWLPENGGGVNIPIYAADTCYVQQNLCQISKILVFSG